MKRLLVPALAVSLACGITIGAMTGCAPGTTSGSEAISQVGIAAVDPADIDIQITGNRIGRGSWEVNTSTQTGTSEKNIGEQQVLVCNLTMTNHSGSETIISPVDMLSASQGGQTLKFGALYDSEGHFQNPEAKTVLPGQTVEGIAIWEIDDLETPVKISFKCGGEPSMTIKPNKIADTTDAE
mgnify:CR=1 FL=1